MHQPLDTMKAWNEGVSLYQALSKFENRLIGWKETEIDIIESKVDILKSLGKVFTGSQEEAKQEAEIALQDLRSYRKQSERIKKSVLEKLKTNELLGLGFALPRSASDVPTIVPNDLWAGQIDWEKSTVSGNGLEMIAVRVVKQPKKAELRIVNRSGRPSRETEIKEIYNDLLNTEVFKATDPKVQIARNLSAEFSIRYPDEDTTGLSEQTLTKYIRKFQREDNSVENQ